MTTATTTTGDKVHLGRALDALAHELNGEVSSADDPGYDRARALWNGMLERSPAVIVRCTGIDDVRAAMQLARDHDLPVAVRGGGTTSPPRPASTMDS